jgi:single-strand DNA-binding protein
MQGFSKIFILGRVGNQPVAQIAKSGESYTRLSIATNYNDTTEWHSVRVWGKQADSCSKYLQKGQGVMVEGYLSNYEVTRDNGEKERRVGINALKVEFLPKPASQIASTTEPT